jgi:hypothetical protein
MSLEKLLASGNELMRAAKATWVCTSRDFWLDFGAVKILSGIGETEPLMGDCHFIDQKLLWGIF